MELDNEPGAVIFLDFEGSDIAAPEAALMARLGYPGPDSCSEAVRAVLTGLLERAPAALAPRAAARFTGLSFSPGGGFALDAPESPVFKAPRVARALSHGSAWAVFALTIGPAFPPPARERDILADFCADAIGSVLAESLAELVEKRLGEIMAAQGLVRGFRYSPGYCDWPVSDNPALLRAIRAEAIGISLTAGGMMIPQKSISGILAFGPPGSQVASPACRWCPDSSCPHRRCRRAD